VYYDAGYGGYIGLVADVNIASKNINQRIEITFDSSNYYSTRLITIANNRTNASFSDYAK